jgi:hypothetical protein
MPLGALSETYSPSLYYETKMFTYKICVMIQYFSPTCSGGQPLKHVGEKYRIITHILYMQIFGFIIEI